MSQMSQRADGRGQRAEGKRAERAEKNAAPPPQISAPASASALSLAFLSLQQLRHYSPVPLAPTYHVHPFSRPSVHFDLTHTVQESLSLQALEFLKHLRSPPRGFVDRAAARPCAAGFSHNASHCSREKEKKKLGTNANMEQQRRRPEYHLDIFADLACVKDVVKGTWLCLLPLVMLSSLPANNFYPPVRSSARSLHLLRILSVDLANVLRHSNSPHHLLPPLLYLDIPPHPRPARPDPPSHRRCRPRDTH